MERIPQIVRDRLQAGIPASAHPDAEMLTAFAERSLSDRERTRVLKHLSQCRDCRDVVAFALPEMEPESAVVVPSRRWWISWPAFRWGFATAGVVIIAVGVLQYQQHSRLASRQEMMAKISQTEPVVTDQPPAASSEPAPQASRVEPAHPELNKDTSRSSGADRLLGKEQTPRSPGANESRVSGYSQGLAHGPNMPTQWQQLQQAPSRALAPAPRMREQAGSGGAATSAQTAEAQSEAVALSAEAQNAGSRAAAAPIHGATAEMFDNLSPPVGKAKAATIQATPVLTAALSTPRWSVTSTGGLQRSFDQGSTWQNVDVNSPSSIGRNYARAANADLAVMEAEAKQNSADKKARKAEVGNPVFRAVAANGSDVWAGGTNGALYHSIDSGNHWTRVVLSSNGSVLRADIVSLQFSDPQHGMVTTSTPEVWTTADSGQTWQKQ